MIADELEHEYIAMFQVYNNCTPIHICASSSSNHIQKLRPINIGYNN